MPTLFAALQQTEYIKDAEDHTFQLKIKSFLINVSAFLSQVRYRVLAGHMLCCLR
jgi:hypothetical protein